MECVFAEPGGTHIQPWASLRGGAYTKLTALPVRDATSHLMIKDNASYVLGGIHLLALSLPVEGDTSPAIVTKTLK